MKANDKQMELINLETLQKQKKQDASGADCQSTAQVSRTRLA